MSKNSVYTITPPDLRLSYNGPVLLLLGVELDDMMTYAEMYENMFPDIELTYMVGDRPLDETTSAWYRSASSIATTILVNVNTASKEELFLAMEAERNDAQLVIWIDKENKDSTLRRLLNSYQYHVFGNIQDVEVFLTSSYEKSA